MSTKRVQDGMVIQFTNGGALISSDDPVVIGTLVGVALVDIANGETGSVAITQVYNLPKVDAAVIAQGEAVHFDVSAGANGEVDDDAATPAAGDLIGWGTAFETKGATTGEDIAILLTPNSQTVVT